MTPEEIQAEHQRLIEADDEALRLMHRHHEAGLGKTGVELRLHRRGADQYIARSCAAWQNICRFKQQHGLK